VIFSGSSDERHTTLAIKGNAQKPGRKIKKSAIIDRREKRQKKSLLLACGESVVVSQTASLPTLPTNSVQQRQESIRNHGVA